MLVSYPCHAVPSLSISYTNWYSNFVLIFVIAYPVSSFRTHVSSFRAHFSSLRTQVRHCVLKFSSLRTYFRHCVLSSVIAYSVSSFPRRLHSFRRHLSFFITYILLFRTHILFRNDFSNFVPRSFLTHNQVRYEMTWA